MSARWSAGFVIGLPIACVAFAIVVGFTVYAWTRGDKREFSDMASGWRIAARMGTAASVALLLGLPWAFFPWSAQYHRYVPKTGTVAAVGGRFLAGDNGGTFQKFVVQFTDGQRYGCMDTRCSLIHQGDRVTLSCIRAWQWTGVPGWDCNYVRDNQAAS